MDQLYEILTLAQQGDETEICSLINKFNPVIRKYARELSYDCAETDLVIAFLEFIKNIEPDRIKDCNDAVLVSYIVKMLRNKKIDLYRNLMLKKIEESHAEYEFVDDSSPHIEEQLDLTRYINQLSDKQRSIIIKKYIIGYSDAEIAHQLNITRQAICKTKNKALCHLKDCITNQKEDEVTWKVK